MTDPLLAGLAAFVTNPTFGLPFVVLTAALLIWMLWEPSVELYRSATRRTFVASAGDALSRTHFALSGRQYARLVLEAQWRLDSVLRRRFRVELRSLPVRSPMGMEVGALAEIREVRGDLIRTYAQARRWEARRTLPERLGPWKRRSWQRFEVRLERFLRACDYLTDRLEGSAG